MPQNVGHVGDLAPSEWVRRCATIIAPGGRVLDLACGSGRHARLLRDLGHAVLAVDRDDSALLVLDRESHIESLRADLETAPWPFEPDSFDAVVVTNYLHRPLFARILETLRIGGILIYETFAAANERYGRPRNPDFLLNRDELLSLAAPLQALAFEQGIIYAPKTAVIQRICAVKAAQLEVLVSPIPVAGVGALR
ncbi:MAG: class I SAM-dependent methyltransferase [Betaproteobacteria bacterium]|nr:class I SAM-dependent methyltransferase [Betaproteobacteria bacterium]